MTRMLSEEDEKKMKEVLTETMDQYIKRVHFWDNQPTQELKPFILTKDETIKHLEELLRQKSDLIKNMEKEIKKLKNKTETCDTWGKDFQCGTESPYHKIVQCFFCGNLQQLRS